MRFLSRAAATSAKSRSLSQSARSPRSGVSKPKTIGDAFRPNSIAVDHNQIVAAVLSNCTRLVVIRVSKAADYNRRDSLAKPAHATVVLFQKACGWKAAPRYIIRDRDAVYGDSSSAAFGRWAIRDRPTAPRSPWQNGYCERAIGSVRRDCLDHVVMVGERHLRHLLRSYATYYNQARTHLSVNKDAPSPRSIHAIGRIVQTPFLGGLHHLYVRV